MLCQPMQHHKFTSLKQKTKKVDTSRQFWDHVRQQGLNQLSVDFNTHSNDLLLTGMNIRWDAQSLNSCLQVFEYGPSGNCIGYSVNVTRVLISSSHELNYTGTITKLARQRSVDDNRHTMLWLYCESWQTYSATSKRHQISKYKKHSKHIFTTSTVTAATDNHHYLT